MPFFFLFSSRRRHTRLQGDWSSDVCSSDLALNSSPASLNDSKMPSEQSTNTSPAASGTWTSSYFELPNDPSGTPAISICSRSEERRVGEVGVYRCDLSLAQEQYNVTNYETA